jgi:hypothetical protein
MEACPAVDAVVHGDGEVPFAHYLAALARGEDKCDLGSVPNLRWRDGPAIRFNGVTHVASRELYSSFDYGISRTVSDLRQYPNGFTMVDAVAGRSKDLLSEKVEDKIFFVNLGRGCSYDCVYCAGCRTSFEAHFRRPAPMARSAEAVLGTIADAYRLGFRRFHFCWDCAFHGKEVLLRKLFEGVRRRIGEDLTLIYEAYRPPSNEFLALCAGSFHQTSVILSPCFYEHTTMRRYMGYSYSLDELEAACRRMQDHPGCTPFIYFAVTPLEDWSEEGLEHKIGVMVRLKRELGCRVSAMPIYAEPGSPWVSFPELFDNHTFPLGFDDFLEEWRKPLGPWSETLSGVRGVSGIMDEIDRAMRIDKLNEV